MTVNRRAVLASIPLIFCPAILSAKSDYDIKLLLLADVSLSITPENYEIQQKGMAQAFRSRYVHQHLTGVNVLVNYSQWSSGHQQFSFGWHRLSTPSDFIAFADLLENAPRKFDDNTGIYGAMMFAEKLLKEVEQFTSDRIIIDVSGDGIENVLTAAGSMTDAETGTAISVVRDRILGISKDLSINGIVIENQPMNTSLYTVEEYYRQYVIGGPLSFVIAVNNFTEFSDNFVRKLVLETS